MARAGTPNQCWRKEFANSPWKIWLMDRPNPQPGHQLIPRLKNGHKLK